MKSVVKIYLKLFIQRSASADQALIAGKSTPTGGVAREVLEALLDKYMNAGIYEIEKTEILHLDPFRKFGKPSRIAVHFGGKEGYLKAIQELEDAIYMDEVA